MGNGGNISCRTVKQGNVDAGLLFYYFNSTVEAVQLYAAFFYGIFGNAEFSGVGIVKKFIN